MRGANKVLCKGCEAEGELQLSSSYERRAPALKGNGMPNCVYCSIGIHGRSEKPTLTTLMEGK